VAVRLRALRGVVFVVFPALEATLFGEKAFGTGGASPFVIWRMHELVA